MVAFWDVVRRWDGVFLRISGRLTNHSTMLLSSVLRPCPDGLVKHLFRIRMEIVAVSGNKRMLCRDATP